MFSSWCHDISFSMHGMSPKGAGSIGSSYSNPFCFQWSNPVAADLLYIEWKQSSHFRLTRCLPRPTQVSRYTYSLKKWYRKLWRHLRTLLADWLRPGLFFVTWLFFFCLRLWPSMFSNRDVVQNWPFSAGRPLCPKARSWGSSAPAKSMPVTVFPPLLNGLWDAANLRKHVQHLACGDISVLIFRWSA
jgi:hypothetical protein